MKTNLNSVFKLLITALAFSILLLCYSCGASKSAKSKTTEEIKTETSNKSTVEKKEESNVKKTEKTTVDDKNETITEETILEPMDPSKPASITEANGNKIDLNNSKKIWKKIHQKNNSKTAVAKASDENHKSKLSELSESDSKSEAKKADEAIQVDREAWNYWNALWFLIPAGVIYFVWNNKVAIGKKLTNLWWI